MSGRGAGKKDDGQTDGGEEAGGNSKGGGDGRPGGAEAMTDLSRAKTSAFALEEKSAPARKVTPIASDGEDLTRFGAENSRGNLSNPSDEAVLPGKLELAKDKVKDGNRNGKGDKKTKTESTDLKRTTKDSTEIASTSKDGSAEEKASATVAKTSEKAARTESVGVAVGIAAVDTEPSVSIRKVSSTVSPKEGMPRKESKALSGAQSLNYIEPPTVARPGESLTKTNKDEDPPSAAARDSIPVTKDFAKPRKEVKQFPIPENIGNTAKTTPTERLDSSKEQPSKIVSPGDTKTSEVEKSEVVAKANGKTAEKSASMLLKYYKTSTVKSHIAEKKSPPRSSSQEEKKLDVELKKVPPDPPSKSQPEENLANKYPADLSGAKSSKRVEFPKETSMKTLSTKSTSDGTDKRDSTKKETQTKKPSTIPMSPSVDEIGVARQTSEAMKSPTTSQEKKWNAQKETEKGLVSTTKKTKIDADDVASSEIKESKASTMSHLSGEERSDAAQKGIQAKRSSPPVVTGQKDTTIPSGLKRFPQESKTAKAPTNLELQKASKLDSENTGASFGKLPSMTKAVEDDKPDTSLSEPRLLKENSTKVSKKVTSAGGDAPKDPKQNLSTDDEAIDSTARPYLALDASTGKLSPASGLKNHPPSNTETSKTEKSRVEGEKSPDIREVPGKQRSPTSPRDTNGENSTATKHSAPRRTPTEHKTIVQMLQEAREEALPRGEKKNADFREYSKSEMVLPDTTPNGARRSESEKQMTSSPDLKVQIGACQRSEETKKGIPRKTDKKSTDHKEISKSEAVLQAAAVTERSKQQDAEKQMTSSPNLAAARSRYVSSAEGLPEADSIARSSPSVVGINGAHHRGHRASDKRCDSRKGSVISETIPEPGGARARSATWSQAAVPASNVAKGGPSAEAVVPSGEAEWDKRWSSAGSDILGERATGRAPGKRVPACPAPIGTGKEWRSEGLAKSIVSGRSNGVSAKVCSSEAIEGMTGDAGGRGERRAWESEAGLARRATTKGQAKFDTAFAADPKSTNHVVEFRRDRKDLVSPSSSTASKGSGMEKTSEASGSYHSVASTRRDSKSEAVVATAREHALSKHAEDKQQTERPIESGDKVKLIDKEEEEEEEGVKRREVGRSGLEVECIVEVGGRGAGRGHRGAGGRRSPRSSRERHGVENQGADLERALEEEEEAAAAASGGGKEETPRLRPYVDLWDNEDKFSVANSQLPLNPSGEEDAGSIGSMLTTEPERGNWTGRFDFLLSLLGYSVGLGNVWRFPYLCYNNGGGAFLIPFTIMLVIAGLPLMFMELSFGQYANLGPAAIYAKFCPLFHGLGYGMVIVSTVVMLYYNLIIAWTIFYMFASLNKQLPWQNCEPEWSTLDCYSYEIADICLDRNGTYYQRTCYNETEAAANNISHLAEVAEKRPPAEEYFNNYVLGLSKGIEETGEIRLSMALCLLLAWAIVFMCLSKGVQSSGKVVYFTALFPYVVLIILFVRGVTLPGASTGILFYLTPDWNRLANAQVWGDAAVQIFFALSPAWGGLITLASYNKFSNNCYKDSLIVAVSNILTSFFAGFVIFSVIGFLAHELNVEVKKVVDQGAGLAFIVYPEVVTRLPVSPLWSLLFFVMLLTLGLDSQFALMETVTTAILDRFPNLREKKVWVVLVVAVLGYFGGLIFTTNSGMYWLQLMDKYAANWSVLLIAISECILIAWVYGADRFLRDVQEMIGQKSRLWMFFWCWMWKLVTPATLLFILFFNWVEYTPASYGEYIYPLWADAAGWVIGVFPVIVIIGVGVVKVYTAPEASLRDRFKRLLQPTPDWGPTLKRSSAPPTYDSIRNTIVLMNGLPVIQESHADGESLEDNTL